ncbi:hypothetical protein [Limosilactobacillus reuteri]|uniref:HNH endonuclease n=1 Tax=Limosilactobacillus reuteri TaxID=1598 RepID=A0ABD6XB09_LIMRT|nr:hypothetical protein [Limosilactobacillus reuteri]PTM22793.1 hypothetical protein DA797_09455 [Limosilactobacillus reuteri]PTM27393.1 hypothetical protein DA796_09360 [Limosilactobacillus reuteri]
MNLKLENYKQTIENETNRFSNGKKASFRLSNCLNIENLDDDLDSYVHTLRRKLNEKSFKSFKQCVIRFAFFIEFSDPKAKTDSTHYQVRWFNHLNGDVRFSSFVECFKIAKKLFKTLSLLDNNDLILLEDFCKNSIFKSELPIDYINKNMDPIHTVDNIKIYIDDNTKKCTIARRIIRDKKLNPDSEIFNDILNHKIKVKAYQTDRAQTGKFQTNREKRWESHPQNYQFAYRRDCNAIETNLIIQICKFKGVNKVLLSNLQKYKLIDKKFDFYKCPITGDVLNYDDLKKEITYPQHGKSNFQVGHLDPLKLTGKHIPENIGWLSADGNRIQGSLSLKQVNDLLKRIYRNRPELVQ